MVFIKMQGQSQASDCAVIRALKWTGEVKQKHMLIFKHCLKWLLLLYQAKWTWKSIALIGAIEIGRG